MIRVAAPGETLTVFPTGFIGVGRYGRRRVDNLVFVNISLKRAAIKYLESNQVQVDGMRNFSQVQEFPHFDRRSAWR
jgi:hypothetical protein